MSSSEVKYTNTTLKISGLNVYAEASGSLLDDIVNKNLPTEGSFCVNNNGTASIKLSALVECIGGDHFVDLSDNLLRELITFIAAKRLGTPPTTKDIRAFDGKTYVNTSLVAKMVFEPAQYDLVQVNTIDVPKPVEVIDAPKVDNPNYVVHLFKNRSKIVIAVSDPDVTSSSIVFMEKGLHLVKLCKSKTNRFAVNIFNDICGRTGNLGDDSYIQRENYRISVPLNIPYWWKGHRSGFIDMFYEVCNCKNITHGSDMNKERILSVGERSGKKYDD